MKTNDIRYSTTVTRINVDTGEVLTEQEAKKYYHLIKTKKEITYADKHKTRRIIKYTKLYRSRQQTELKFED